MSAWTYAAWTTCIALAIAATVTDLTRGKVYNWLTAPAFLLGFVFHGFDGGVAGLTVAAGGVGVAIGLLFALGLIGRLMGGGDAKLLLATGALLGPWLLLKAFAAGALIGGLVALAIMLAKRRLACEFTNLVRSLAARVWAKVPVDVYASRSIRIPYAVPLAAGVIFAILLQTGAILP